MDFQPSGNRQYNNYGNNQNRPQGGNRGYNNNNNNNNNNNRGGNYQRRNYNNNSGNDKQDRTPRPGEDRPKRDAILDLAQYLNKRVKINCLSRREVIGVLKGYDQLMNLVIDDTTEVVYKEKLAGPSEVKRRKLGRVILRSNLLYEISPADGIEEIDSPFIVTKSVADEEREKQEAQQQA